MSERRRDRLSNWLHAHLHPQSGDSSRAPNPTPGTPTSISTPSAPAANDQTTVPAESLSTTACSIDNLTAVLGLVEQVANIVQKVPFIAPAAALMTEILKVYKEVKGTNEKRDVLLANITDLSRDLCGTVLRMEATNHFNLIGRLEADIETYALLLTKASAFIKDYNDHGLMSHIAARNELGTKFTALTRELDSFGARFKSNRLVDLVINQRVIAVTVEDINITVTAEKLERWLDSPPDMKRKQSETLRLRKEGTGLWLLEGKMFQHWQDNPESLWIQGNSGAGKSVLSSAIINKLGTFDQVFKELPAKNAPRSPPVAFFYFDFRNNEGNPVEAALRRITLQLSAHSPYPYRTLDKEYKKSNGQTLPTYEDLLEVLKELLMELGRTYIVLDALDECKEANVDQLLDLISVLRSWTQSPLHLLITSQPRSTFIEHFKNVPCVLLKAAVTGKDIHLFVTEELQKSALKGWTSRADYIIECIVRKSNGMFRLAACLLVEISRRWTNVGELDKMLDRLPHELFGIYDHFLEAIDPADLVYATGVLRWIIFSTGERTLDELADAVAFDFSNPTQYIYEPNRRSGNEVAIRQWLEGLVIVSDLHPTVILAHASVQDYVLSKDFTHKFGHDLNSKLSHTFIAQSCIHYLLYFSDHPEAYLSFTRKGHFLISDHPLGNYAARTWYQHLLLSHDRTILLTSAMHLLKEGNSQYHALHYFYNMYEPWKKSLPALPLHLCCHNGYIEGVHSLLERGADVNEVIPGKGTWGRTPLYFAVKEGHTDIIRLLLKNNADPNIEVINSGTVLDVASSQGNTEMVRVLLENGAHMNAGGRKYGSTLYVAAVNGQTEVVQLLLEKSADMNATGGKYGGALQAAFSKNHKEVARLLLANGADVNAGGGEAGSALVAASIQGNTEGVHLLLAKGADVNTTGGKYGSALQAASKIGKTQLVQLLLDNGADVNATGGKYGSALQAACADWNDDTECVLLLLQHGADVNIMTGNYSSPLQIASERGNLKMVQLLLKNGAHVNATGGEYGSALQAASMEGHIKIVRLLFAEGADVNATGGKYGSALQAASKIGKTQLVKLLLDNGADVNATGGKYGSALQAASKIGKIQLVKLLLDNGADVNAMGGKYGSALRAASSYDTRILLLKNGAIDTRACVNDSDTSESESSALESESESESEFSVASM
ncbi:ankyrin repeat-containing domain protein, partial [Mycena latifolia]